MSTVSIEDGEVISPEMAQSSTTLQNEGSYDFNNLVFPLSIGQSHLGHWMKININVPVNKDTLAGSEFTTQEIGNKLLNRELSTLDRLRGEERNVFTPVSEIPGSSYIPFRSPFVERNTRRITSTIILSMPYNNIIFNSENDYENIALTAYGAGGLAAIATGVAGAVSQKLATHIAKISNAIGRAVGTATTLAGYPLNPRLEILFSGRRQRQFAFEILMTPTNREEAEAIKNIIYTLRFHSSPDLIYGGWFFVPPAEFDIEFYKDGKRNENIPRINTCALERIEVDYSPGGTYATFSTGHPVQIRMSLGFREIEVLHKRRIQQGF